MFRPALPVAAWAAVVFAAPRDPAPQTQPLPIRLRPRTPVPVHRVPGGEPVAVLPVQALPGLPAWLPAVDERHGWVQVLLPTRPDGATGWIKRDDRVECLDHPVCLDIDTAVRSFTLRHGRNLLTWPASVGWGAGPAPRRRTFVLGETLSGDCTARRGLLLADHWPGDGDAAVGGLRIEPGLPPGRSAAAGSVAVPSDAIPVLAVCAAPGTPVLIR